MIAIKPKNVDEYIASFPNDIQEILEAIRGTIIKAAPQAVEVIRYNMPAYKQNAVLVYFAAYKNHIGFYPTSSPIRVFKDDLKDYKTSKGAIQFLLYKPLPHKLITKIVHYKVTEDKKRYQTSK